MTMYMEHDGPPDTKPRGSSGYLPGGVSGEKPAPTAEEIAAARQHAAMLRDRFPERTRIENVAVALLAALDAAEALEKAAEDKLARACALADRTAASHVETRTRAETAERERDSALAALKPFAIYAKSCHAMTAEEAVAWDDDGVVRKITVGDLRRASEIVKEAPRG